MGIAKGSVVLLAAAGLLTGAGAFIAPVHSATATRRHADGTPAARAARGASPTPQAFTRATSASSPAASNTALFAKATYTSFEEMLQKEPGPLLVDFYATWCGPCQMMGEALKEVGPKMKGEVKVMKIDSDKYPSLTEKFSVAGLPTLILFKDGKELQRMEGFLPANQLMEQVRYYLQGSAAGDGAAPGQEQGGACQPPPLQDACAPSESATSDACAPPAQDACSPPKRDACAPPSSEA